MSYVKKSLLNLTSDIEEARYLVHMSTVDCIELCGVSRTTWYRWKRSKAPVWAIRLILSQTGRLDHLGWKDWEIRGGCLYNNQLSYRYYWTPTQLVMPLYGIKSSDVVWKESCANLASLEEARKERNASKPLNNQSFPKNPQKPNCA